MSWVDVLLIAAFVLFPLIQQLLERSRRSQLPPEEGSQESASPIETEPTGTPWGMGGEGWTADEAAEPVGGEELQDEEEEGLREAESPYGTLARPDVPMSTSVNVVSLEPLHVDHVTEHDRLHRRAVPPALPPTRRPGSLRDSLRGRRELRRAVILAEVLGPPKALR